MEELIRRCHSRQFRNGAIPYTDHLYGVKSVLLSALTEPGECQDPELIADLCDAALGHDLLEDTEVTEAEIVSAANARVLGLIRELTNPVDDAHTEQYMEQLSCSTEEARLVKYADLIENTTSVAYNYYTLGEAWFTGFYAPILHRTTEVLAETDFVRYPQTAAYLRSLLRASERLLEAKRRNAIAEGKC